MPQDNKKGLIIFFPESLSSLWLSSQTQNITVFDKKELIPLCSVFVGDRHLYIMHLKMRCVKFWKRLRIPTNFLSTWEKEYLISFELKTKFSSQVGFAMMKLSFAKSFIKFSLSGQLRFLVFQSDDISGYHVSLIKCTASKDVATHGLFSIFTIPSNLTDDLFIPCSILVKVISGNFLFNK